MHSTGEAVARRSSRIAWAWDPKGPAVCEVFESWRHRKEKLFPRDTWGTAPRVHCDREKGVYVLRSAGPDQRFGTRDDVEIARTPVSMGTYKPQAPTTSDSWRRLRSLPSLPCTRDGRPRCSALKTWQEQNALPEDHSGTAFKLRCDPGEPFYVFESAGEDRTFDTLDDYEIPHVRVVQCAP